MASTSLWLCFAAIVAGSAVTAWQTWHHYGRGTGTAAFLGVWFLLALVAGSSGMVSPDLRLPAWAPPLAVAILTIIMNVAVAQRPSMHQASKAARLSDWYGVQRVRLYFGVAIVVGSALGFLPWEFALTAGLGDIAVGAAGFALRRLERQSLAPRSPGLAWVFTGAGMVDLTNAVRLAGGMVAPWLLEREIPGFLLMLPLFVVPVMLSNHFQTVRHLARVREAKAATA